MITEPFVSSKLFSFGCAIFDLLLSDADSEDQKHIELLESLPDKNDIVLESSIKVAGSILNAHKQRLQLGGCSLNTLRLFNHLNFIYHNLECSSCFIFSTGDDKLSEFYCEMLDLTGVRKIPLINKGKSNSYCMAKMDKNKDKSFYSNNQTAKMITLDHINIVLKSEFRDSEVPKFFLLDSYLINDCYDAYILVCEYLKHKSNVKIVYNVADTYFYSRYSDKINNIIKEYADVLICNESELELLLLKNSIDQSVTPEAFLSLAKIFTYPQDSDKYGRSKILISTRAENPTLLALGQLKDGVNTTEIVECEVDAIEKEKIVDFLGAGDAFTSGFLYGYMQFLTNKKSLDIADYKKCLKLGNCVASKTICIKGFNISEEHTLDYLKFTEELLK